MTYNTLVDSPLYAGLYFNRVDLDPGAAVPVHLDVFADAPQDLRMTAQQLQAHRNLVTQAYRLFGSHHYDHYDFLYSLSDQLSGNGLEHHQSSEDGTRANYFTDWDNTAPGRDLLAHEYTHSWNGKFRRPADLWTPNFNVPMGDSLLWVYEGQTQYWGYVLTARAGMWSASQFRQALALVAANYDRDRPGFEWRTLEDTTWRRRCSRLSTRTLRSGSCCVTRASTRQSPSVTTAVRDTRTSYASTARPIIWTRSSPPKNDPWVGRPRGARWREVGDQPCTTACTTRLYSKKTENDG
ncbi:MAG TPA: hypothetical protein VMD06_03375 [Steroidobacteraceae bacterium]|nr:hypothetical protein [Steroidobacteraceae bacterium]